ncbi:deoxyribonuclease-2-alpha [Pelodiscus sinensis]|uniref:deoxyribonuclease-2-alpha n=1 Tax=Pelodiscus sinensis TaxID=13735 RepID=UPI003F6B96A1
MGSKWLLSNLWNVALATVTGGWRLAGGGYVPSATPRQQKDGCHVSAACYGSTAEENARLRELIAEELARAERWQGHYEALLERQTWLRAQLRPQSLSALEQAARALREQLEEALGAMREQQEQSRQRQHRIHRREKENQRLAGPIQELEGKVSEQRESEKTHKQALQQLLVQGDELQRQLWDMETKHQARANRIKETQQHVEELSRTIQELSRRTQVPERGATWPPKDPARQPAVGGESVGSDGEAAASGGGGVRAKGPTPPQGTVPAAPAWWPPRMLPLFLLAVALPHVAGGGISCYDDAGQPVDWFLAYKLPRSRAQAWSGPLGLRYMYQDARSGGWVPGRALMNSTQSAVGRTLLQLYQGVSRRTEDTAYILYNDQPPKNIPPSPSSSSSRGHTKGVVLLDRHQGFWLRHSTPHFPPLAAYAWPHSALHNGQSFLCVTFPYAQFKQIGMQLRLADPLVYESRVQGAFAQDLPDLCLASKMQHVREPPWNRSVALTSLGGRPFLSLAKFRLFQDDLYSGWLAQVLSSDLYVQFWPNSRGVLPSNCSGLYRVYNVQDLGFPAPQLNFSATVDHSKWCVSTESAPGWACVGDMNRNVAEEQRGGGALCQQDPAVWKSYYTLVQSYSKC